LKNCYGINALDHEFDFTNCNAVIIYASNGVMKTSFARTFDRLSQGMEPEELIYGNTPEYEIKYDDQPISKEQIYVIKDFKPNIFKDELISKLVVDEESKTKYDAIFADIESKRKLILLKLTKLSGVPQSNLEKELKPIFKFEDFSEFLCNLDLEEFTELDIDYKYTNIFNSDVLPILGESDIHNVIVEYNQEMNRIINEIALFNKAGEFNLTKAENVAKTLKKEMFFRAGHTIMLSGTEDNIDEKKYKELLDKANSEIKKSEKLKDLRQRLLKKNSLKEFADLIERNPAIIQELEDKPNLQKKLFESYFKSIESDISEYNQLYTDSISTLNEIEEKARNQQTKWKSIVDQFKNRFSTPYDDVDILDMPSVVLGKTTTPQIVFKFGDKEHTKDDLFKKNTLSEGEGRAYSLLNILYELEIRKDAPDVQFIIVDDLADSFDYKNKYAILQYLRDLIGCSNFRLIILTHNFDFYRSLVSRILGTTRPSSRWNNSFITEKNSSGIKLYGGGHRYLISNPFEAWKNSAKNDIEKTIALIPFMRNLIEYNFGTNNIHYLNLTKLLHSKNDSTSITLQNLQDAYAQVMTGLNFSFVDYDYQDSVQSIIFDLADNADFSDDQFRLKEKIIVSIAIRILSEKYMWSKVKNNIDRDTLTEGQLLDRYKSEFQNDQSMEILESVNMMTPENIHLNAFMFEPIIDIPSEHLIGLYNQAKSL